MTGHAEPDTATGMTFTVLKQATGDQRTRLGRLARQGKKPIETPHHIGTTSRGVVPHLSPDTMAKKTELKGVYIALEDFIEKAASKKTPPLFHPQNLISAHPLRDFISLPQDQLLILGARRSPAVQSPHSNTQTAVSIYTSVGFNMLESADFADAARKLNPDIVIGLGDIPSGEKPGQRRTEKMSSRTQHFMKRVMHAADGNESDTLKGKVFAPILPIEKTQQSLYLDLLVEEWRVLLGGLAIYDADNVLDLPAELQHLPRLAFSTPDTPHKVLREVLLGIDIFTLPFIGAATDAGIALDFLFPPQLDEAGDQKPLGIEMASEEHAASLEPLVKRCDCFACTKHHRAYIQHLLSAKEMLAWVLLQIHNLRVVERFFDGVRNSIAENGLEKDSEMFSKFYEREMPQGLRQGPRIRGYQYRSEGPGESKKNAPAYKMLNDRQEQNSEAPTPGSQTPAALTEQGFARPDGGK